MTLAEIINQRAAICVELGEHNRAHEQYVKDAKQRLAVLEHDEALLSAGVDVERIRRGLKIVSIDGRHSKPVSGASWRTNQLSLGDRLQVVEDAKLDIANGVRLLRTQFFGVKNYDSFGDQRCDCSYGSGPQHGSIVFSIGLTRAALKIAEFTPEQIEDALYVLVNLDHVDAAREKSAAA